MGLNPIDAPLEANPPLKPDISQPLEKPQNPKAKQPPPKSSEQIINQRKIDTRA